MLFALIALTGCNRDFTGILAADMDAGVLLGGYTDGDEAILVGGDFAGTGSVVRWDGDTLCAEADVVDDVLWWVHGASPGDWYAVGAGGVVLHESSGTRTREDIPSTETLFGVWADGGEVWAVSSDVIGGTGTIWRQDGATWEAELVTPDLMFKVWNGWFIGNGLAYYWTGSELEERHPPGGERLTTIRGRSAEDAWAVGGLTTPVVLRWSGGAWEAIPWEPRCGGQNGLNGIWTAEGEDVWVAGHVGTAARWDGSEWTCNEAPVTADDFHFVWKHDDHFLWGGGNLFATTDNHGVVVMHPAPRKPVEVGVCP